MNKTAYLTIYLLYFSVILLSAQNFTLGKPTVHNFSRAAYQAGTQNWMAKQDPQTGFLYFANNKGLLEYDGTSWRTLPMPNGTIVRSLAISQQGKIFVGGQDEFGYWARMPNSDLTYHSLTPLVPEEVASFEDIWKIFLLDENLFFCSLNTIFQMKGEQVKVIKPPQGRFQNFFQVENEVYAQVETGAVYRIHEAQLDFQFFSDQIGQDRIIGIFPQPDGQQLIFTHTNGLFINDKTTISPVKSALCTFLRRHYTYCVSRMSNGHFAIGTTQDGLLIIDANSDPQQHLNLKSGLQNNTILGLCTDEHNNLWLALDNGIDYVEISSPFSSIKNEDGVDGTGYTSAIFEKKLYLGTNQGLFATPIAGGLDLTTVNRFEMVANSQGQVWSSAVIGTDLIVGQHRGVSQLYRQNLAPFSNVQGSWKFMPISDSQEYAIEGTYAGFHLYKKSSSTGEWKYVHKIAGFDESARIFELDTRGDIWISHAYKGLYRLRLDASLSMFTEQKLYGTKDGLPDHPLVNVTPIRDGLLFTTTSGVYKYDAKEDRFNLDPGFLDIFGPNRNFHRIIEDSNGDIWFSVDEEFGVLRLKEEGVVNTYDIKYFNHLQEDLVDGFEHIYAINEQQVLIGAESGFIQYNANQANKTEFTFPVQIRNVASISAKDSIILWNAGEVTQKSQAKFQPHTNDLRFHFSVPFYEKADFLSYRYRLHGFAENWSNWSSKVEKEYTNLSAGDYQFEVQAKNAYGVVSETAIFPFSIAAPWYLTTSAKVLYGLLLFLGMLALIQFVRRREKKKTEAFKVEQRERLQQKEEAFKKEVDRTEREIIQLRNDKLRNDIQHKTGQLAAATMHLVQKSEILQKIKNDLKQLETSATPEVRKKVKKITRAIESDIRLDENWDQFEQHFDQVHENFLKRLRQNYPSLTPKDQKLCAYLRMNLSTKEIAPLMNISVRGVEISRYRLRKKLAIPSEVNLVSFMLEL